MNIERMSWDDLRFALALARHPTMIAAANALHVHQSTVSRRIQALELDLGVKLFELSESGIVMTESGRRVAQRAEKIETLTAELESDIDTERPDDRQSVRISAVSTFITGFLNRHAAAFLSDNPDIRLDFVGEERNAVLERREADMAIRHVRPAGGQARIRKLADMSTTVYAAPKFIQSNGALKPDVPWVGFSRPLDFLPEQQWIDANVAPKNIIVTLASSATYADTVTREIGVGMLSCMVGDQRNNLQRVISSVPIMHRESWTTHANALPFVQSSTG
jgi:DNA-binding transcriptional LysR family regulator